LWCGVKISSSAVRCSASSRTMIFDVFMTLMIRGTSDGQRASL
jgi:hypothetical protein